MEINIDALAEEFNLDSQDASFDDCQINVNSLTADKPMDPDEVLSTNVNKANAILDRVIIEINRSGMTPRLGEVASQLISTINQAVSQVYTKSNELDGILLRKRLVELREREVIVKEKLSQLTSNSDGTVNNNLIVTDRETVLRLLKENKDKIKMIENNDDAIDVQSE
jgi:hypothetical protein